MDPFRVYLDPAEIGLDGYPYAWHRSTLLSGGVGAPTGGPVKDLVRARAENRCERCRHPYVGGGEWTACDGACTHYGPVRLRENDLSGDLDWRYHDLGRIGVTAAHARVDTGPLGYAVIRFDVEAQWRVLTVHHLNGIKHDLRWWNLVALCQRCHLSVQSRVVMDRVWPWEHSDWFKPYAAGWYAFAYEGRDISREEAIADLDRLLALERA